MRPGSVAVFGGSEPIAGDVIYEDARLLGRLLAERGYAVVNGGYGGVMEASSRGARDAGGAAVGVTTDAFPSRSGGNAYLTEELREPDLFLRTRTLVERADAFVVLPGRSGTLAELAFLWALRRAGLLGDRPTVLLGEVWEELLGLLRERGVLEPEVREATRVAASPEQAANLVALGLQAFDRFRKGSTAA